MATKKSLARHDTAVKAIFLLWKRGRWGALKQVFPNLLREEIEQRMVTFDQLWIEDDQGIKTDEQMFALIQIFPEIVSAAIDMVGVYEMEGRRGGSKES